jgi:predicted amidohydrolase YtcJ
MHRFLLLALLCLHGLAMAQPQLIVRNAKVFTGDERQPSAEAVAIEKGRFSAVGRDSDVVALAGPNTRIVDARGRRVIPGLIEAHVHLGSGFPPFAQPVEPLRFAGSPLAGASADELVAAVQAAARTPGNWIIGPIGMRALRDGRNWREALDAAAGERPVMLRPVWGHVTVLNSAAMARLGITEDAADPLAGWLGRDDKGRLDGQAFEGAVRVGWERIGPPSVERTAEVFRAAAERYARWGVTSIHLMNDGKTLHFTSDVLSRLQPRQKWTVYSWAMHSPSIGAAWDAVAGAAPPWPARVRMDGPKWMIDGTPLERNALLRADYPGKPVWR